MDVVQLLQGGNRSFVGVKGYDAKALRRCGAVVVQVCVRGASRYVCNTSTLDSWVMALRKKSTSTTVLCCSVKKAASSSADMCGGTREKNSWGEEVGR